MTLKDAVNETFQEWTARVHDTHYVLGSVMGPHPFSRYPADEKLDLIGILNCSGCPTLAGPEKLLGRIRALAEFRIDAIHFSYCMDALCPYKEKYKKLLQEHFPGIEIVIGTHEAHITHEQFREDVKKQSVRMF